MPLPPLPIPQIHEIPLRCYQLIFPAITHKPHQYHLDENENCRFGSRSTNRAPASGQELSDELTKAQSRSRQRRQDGEVTISRELYSALQEHLRGCSDTDTYSDSNPRSEESSREMMQFRQGSPGMPLMGDGFIPSNAGGTQVYESLSTVEESARRYQELLALLPQPGQGLAAMLSAKTADPIGIPHQWLMVKVKAAVEERRRSLSNRGSDMGEVISVKRGSFRDIRETTVMSKEEKGKQEKLNREREALARKQKNSLESTDEVSEQKSTQKDVQDEHEVGSRNESKDNISDISDVPDPRVRAEIRIKGDEGSEYSGDDGAYDALSAVSSEIENHTANRTAE